MIKFVGTQQLKQQIDTEMARFEQLCVEETQKATRVLLEALFMRTPVWVGETVRNYSVGIGRKPSGAPKKHIGPKPPPDHTNSLPIGVEHNRPANENAVRGETEAALGGMKKLRDIFIGNTVDPGKWDLIEHGSAPEKPRARNPGGVSMLAEQSARNKLEHFK